jgi:3-isopropylmalate dehydrogenase
MAADASDVTRTHAVTHLPGDGVGPEVTDGARACVDAVAGRHGFGIDWRSCDLGGQHYLATGEVLPDPVLAELRRSDAVLLGAVGTPDVPPGVLERGLLLRLRFELDLYVNLRPSKLRPGVGSAVGKHQPSDLDFVIVRENTEGLYAGAGGTVHRGSDFETATEESLNTRAGVQRCVQYAASLAASRSGRLTLVHKTNVLTHAGDLWHRVAREVAADAGVELRARGRGVPVDGRRSEAVRRDRHRQPVRRHHFRPRGGADRRPGLRAEREPEP